MYENNGDISVVSDKICNRHQITVNEIKGNTEGENTVGVKQKDGTYDVTIVISNAPMIFGKGGKI